MNPEQYAAQQAAIAAAVAAYVRRFASIFTGPALSLAEWAKFLQLLFPEVQRRYAQSAALGREFYDSQRVRFHPSLPRNERFLSELDWKQFVQNMEPARKAMSQADSPQSAVTRAVLTATREVEMAARRQIIGAVKNDPEPVIQGWARIATGRETCSWCLMLISRGAELNHKGNFAYREGSTAGSTLDDVTLLDLWKESGGSLEQFREDTAEYMEQWHAGCDCLAVPVFDVNNWPGRDAAIRAQRLWIDATNEARRLIDSGEARSKNMNKEAQNALRRRLERGDISMSNYAFAA